MKLKVAGIKEKYFGSQISLIHSTRADLDNYMKSKYGCTMTSTYDTKGMFFTVASADQGFIWIDSKQPRAKKLEVLVHEACHAAFRILDHMGFKYADESEEMYCYMIDEIFSKIYPKL